MTQQDIAGAVDTGATVAPSPETSQPDSPAFTAEDLKQLIREVNQPILDRQYQSFDRRNTELKAELAEVRASLQEANTIIRAIAQGTISEEDMTRIEAERVKRTLESQVDSLKAQIDAKQPEDKGDPIQEARDAAKYEAILDSVTEYANEEGLTPRELMSCKPNERVATTADPDGTKGFLRTWRSNIRKMADQKGNDAVPPPRTPTERAVAGSSPTKFTRQDIANMTPEEFQRNKGAIFKALGAKT